MRRRKVPEILEETSPCSSIVGGVTMRRLAIGKFPNVPSGELKDELYFKEGRFCNDPSLLQYRQSFSTNRSRQSNSCGDSSALDEEDR